MRTLIKVSPDKRFYVIWSSHIGGPVAWGSRPHLTDSGRLYDTLRRDRLIQNKNAFAIANAYGSATEYAESAQYDWDCDPIPYTDAIYGNLNGYIQRKDLPDFMEAFIEAGSRNASKTRHELLRPYLING